MIIFNKATVPPGGWSYTEKSTQYKMVAMTYDNLFDQIEDHRIANGLDVSKGWRGRVVDELCETLPDGYCLDQNAPPPVRKTNIGDVKNFMKTIARWSASSDKYVSQDEAEQRAKICSTCPKNIHIKGCKGEG